MTQTTSSTDPQVRAVLANRFAAGAAWRASIAAGREDYTAVRESVREACEAACSRAQALAWTEDVVIAAGDVARAEREQERLRERQTRPGSAARAMLAAHRGLRARADRHPGGREQWVAEVAHDIRELVDGRVIGPGRTYEDELDGAAGVVEHRLLWCVRADEDARARVELPVLAAEAIYRDRMPKAGAYYPATWPRDVGP